MDEQLSKDQIWKMYSEVGVIERHFNDLQGKYRVMASTWLLATFAALGFIFTQTLNTRIPGELIAAGIATASAIGISLIWVLDLLVYHRLLAAAFAEGYELEQQYDWLPCIHTNMYNLHNGIGVLPKVVWFYLSGVAIQSLIGSVTLSIWLSEKYPNLFWAILLSYIGLVLYALLTIYRATGNTIEIEEQINRYVPDQDEERTDNRD
jgi:hypothetical protein